MPPTICQRSPAFIQVGVNFLQMLAPLLKISSIEFGRVLQEQRKSRPRYHLFHVVPD